MAAALELKDEAGELFMAAESMKKALLCLECEECEETAETRTLCLSIVVQLVQTYPDTNTLRVCISRFNALRALPEIVADIRPADIMSVFVATMHTHMFPINYSQEAALASAPCDHAPPAASQDLHG